MSEEIKVSVNSWGAGRNLVLSWTDPTTDLRKTRSAKTKDWRTAERLAGELEKELAAGQVSPSKITWSEFVRRYDAEKLATLAPSSRRSALGSLRQVKRVLGIEQLAKLSASAMSTFQAECRKEGMKDTTLAHHLRHIKAATRWAVKLGLMSKAPAVEMPKRAKGSQARSRPITAEEYERALLTIPKARPQDAAQWERYITGLWLSGLRRSEALALSWDQDQAFCVHLGEKRPVFIIRAEGQKSGKAETCPMAPEFGAWLLAVPEAERTGRVFHLVNVRTNQPLCENRVGRIVEKIGRKAGIKVGTRTKRKDGKATTVPVFAGCHSYRRGFGSKWARRVAPSVLKRLMRHASIATTEAYYVHLNASDVADELWERFGVPPAGSQPVVDAGLQQSSNIPPIESIGR